MRIGLLEQRVDCDLRSLYRPLIAISIFVLLGLVSGCATRINQFKSFSDVGVAYTDTMDKLLKTAGGVSIDSDSATLQAGSRAADADCLPKSLLDCRDELLKKRLDVLTALRKHGQLLKSYFEALAELAENKSSADIAKATGNIVTGLGKLNPTIASAKLGNATIGSFIQPATELGITNFQQAALDKELKNNAQMIERELDLQTASIKAISAILVADSANILHLREVTYKTQFGENQKLPDRWPAMRKAVLINASYEDLTASATEASEKLKTAFENLVSNRIDPKDIAQIQNDLDKVLSLIELIEKGPPPS